MEKENIKIVVLGAGSSYTPELIEGLLLRYDTLKISELWLVDIEEGKEKLKIIADLAKRMIQNKASIKIQTTCQRKEALADADYVLTQIRVGGLQARILDERIPLSHGMIGQETNGAGGMFQAFRAIPVIFDIIYDMQQLCPNAWLINFTNPVGIIMEAILQHTNFTRAIGLCNVPINMAAGFAQMLQVKESDITMQLQGINHFVFATDIWAKGESRFQEVLQQYAHLDQKKRIQMKNFISHPYSHSLLTGLQAIPCPYHDYYFFTKEQLEEERSQYNQHLVRGEIIVQLEKELFSIYQNELLDHKPEQLSKRGGAKYSDAACSLIQSIHNDTGDIQYVNVQNNGTIADLPLSCAIEAACRIGKDGPKPFVTGKLKQPISGMIHMMKTFEQLCAKAAVYGDRDLAITALALNPLCASSTLAHIVVDEMLKAHKAYLPQF